LRENVLGESPTPPAELSDVELVDNVLRGAPGAIDAFYIATAA
jgi:hypothetical protein